MLTFFLFHSIFAAMLLIMVDAQATAPASTWRDELASNDGMRTAMAVTSKIHKLLRSTISIAGVVDRSTAYTEL
jgi:hypothetical protein